MESYRFRENPTWRSTDKNSGLTPPPKPGKKHPGDEVGVVQRGLRELRVGAKYKFRYENLKSKFSIFLFACNVMN